MSTNKRRRKPRSADLLIMQWLDSFFLLRNSIFLYTQWYMSHAKEIPPWHETHPPVAQILRNVMTVKMAYAECESIFFFDGGKPTRPPLPSIKLTELVV